MAVKKKFLLFDVDGTLVDAGGAGRRALTAALVGNGVAAAAVDAIPFAGMTDRGIVFAALRATGRAETDLATAQERIGASYLRRLAEELALKPARAYPFADDLLRACRQRDDLESILLTGNMSEGARLKLESAALWNHFSWGVFGDRSEDRCQLAAEAWRRIRGSHDRVDASNVYIIGDTRADIACGRSIHAVTVAVTTGFETEEQLRAAAPDHLIDNLRPLFGLWHLSQPQKKSPLA